jgi:hypothetical protein
MTLQLLKYLRLYALSLSAANEVDETQSRNVGRLPLDSPNASASPSEG